jgi:hypothetical protein
VYLNTRLCSDGISVFERGLKIRDNAAIPGNCMIECPEDRAYDRADGKPSEADGHPEEVVEYHFRVK